MKDMMIEAYERGWCSYEDSYDFVREQLADHADHERKRRRESDSPDPEKIKGIDNEPHPSQK